MIQEFKLLSDQIKKLFFLKFYFTLNQSHLFIRMDNRFQIKNK